MEAPTRLPSWQAWARLALVVAACAATAEAFMPRPSKQATAAAVAGKPGGACCSTTAAAPLGPMKELRSAVPTTRLGSSAMMDSSPSDVEADGSAPSDTSDDSNREFSTSSSSSSSSSVATDAATAGSSSSSSIGSSGTGGQPSVGGSVKDELIELIAGGLLDFASPRKRATVNELLLKLEALNPTPAPATSPLLNGAWEFLYTGGISPGILGLQLASRLSSLASGAVEVGDTVLTISRAQPRVEVTTQLKVFGRDNTIKIRTRLEPASELRLDETYVEASTGSLRVPFPEQELFTRPLFVSYLDDDLLVVRDMFGAPDVLIRKDKDFLSSNTGVPSVTDDDLAPGAG